MENNNISNTHIRHDDPCVHKHLDLLQSVISRMALNSGSCKSWCITLVSGMLVVIIDKDLPILILLALMPTILFTLLDSYYLSMERCFRENYKIFIKNLHNKTLTVEDLYQLKGPLGNKEAFIGALNAIRSFSVWPFYLFIIASIISVYLLLAEKFNQIIIWITTG